MRSEPTPPEMLEELMADPMANVCWRAWFFKDHKCAGRLTWEHAFTHAGKRVNEVWAIIRLCEYAHSLGAFMDTGILNKEINRCIGYRRITDWDAVEKKYPRTNWRQEYKYLTTKYG